MKATDIENLVFRELLVQVRTMAKIVNAKIELDKVVERHQHDV